MTAANVKGWTPGPWETWGEPTRDDPSVKIVAGNTFIAVTIGGNDVANAHLIAASPVMADEMERFLPVIERAEADPELWARLTEGTGIATANGYRAALSRATGAATKGDSHE